MFFGCFISSFLFVFVTSIFFLFFLFLGCLFTILLFCSSEGGGGAAGEGRSAGAEAESPRGRGGAGGGDAEAESPRGRGGGGGGGGHGRRGGIGVLLKNAVMLGRIPCCEGSSVVNGIMSAGEGRRGRMHWDGKRSFLHGIGGVKRVGSNLSLSLHGIIKGVKRGGGMGHGM